MKPKKRRRSLFPKPLDACLQPVTSPVFSRAGLAGNRIISEWQRIAGPQLAAKTVPVKVSFPKGKTTEGTLTIAVQTGFSTQLQHMQPVLLEKLAMYFGYKAISRIRIHHSYPATPAQPASQPAAAPEPRHIPAHLVDEVADTELKHTLQSFAQTLSAPKKPH